MKSLPLLAFQRAINQGRASALTYPKCGSDIQICRFRKILRKTIKSLLQSFTSGNVVARSTTYRTVLTVWQGMNPFP